ncbi:MAG: YggS family pyridoxal phosphate-dependent enzyme [Ignavibacteria bacterium]|nr:YggS family pyridoxal phosphate-dependent enzyme [Ignavibacteria bacterium]
MMEYAYLKENYDELVNDIKNVCTEYGRNFSDITLVAVSKTFPPEQIAEVRKLGQVIFGENKVQELKEKYDILRDAGFKDGVYGGILKDIKWHLVGHLQTNKVKYIVEFVDLIHSVDSLKLAEVINEQAEKHNRIIDILVQVNTSGEDQKSGIEPEDAEILCEDISKLKNIRLKGLMTIGMFTDNEEIIRSNFKVLRELFSQLKSKHGSFEYLSMGMTSDYRIAVEEGANMLRIGSAVFGHRNYQR